MDFNGNRKLDLEEFTQALNTFGFFPKVVEIQALHKFYDIDGDGNISYEEFLRGLREPLTERRKAIVKRAFDLMDKDGSGQIQVKDVAHIYDVSQNKDFQEGKKTAEQVIEDFLNSFEGVKGNRDGVISWEEWLDYYTDLSMSIPLEDYFVRMMESTWQICEDETQTVSQNQIEVLTKAMRQKLLSFSRQSQDEYVLREVFRQFDFNGDGVLTADELGAMLVKLQISCERRYLNALLKKFDRNGNGVIEFEEFCEFLIKNPYK